MEISSAILESTPVSSSESEPSASSIFRAAFHWDSLDEEMIYFGDNQDDVATSLRSTVSSHATNSPGPLEGLPTELMYEVCLQLDMASLFRFRQSSRWARMFVGAMNEYQAVVSTSLTSFRALLRGRTAHRVTLPDFYRTLCSSACELCRADFAHLVYLPTWKRFCWTCMYGLSDSVATVPLAYVLEHLELKDSSSESLAVMKGIPGCYGPADRRPPGQRVITSLTELVPLHKVELAYLQQYGHDLQFKLLHEGSILHFEYAACCPLPIYDRYSGQFDNGVLCRGCYRLANTPLGRGIWRLHERLKVYSRDGFLAHFKVCQKAQDHLMRLDDDSGMYFRA